MRYFIVAGEKSGDLHAGNLATAILSLDSEASIWGWGGETMQAAGVKILKNYTELAVMGFWEVITSLRKILGFMKTCKAQIEEFKPDALILVDYGGFNLRLAKWAKSKHYKVFYYIPPKAWAWNQNRAYKLRAVDLTLAIFPFEIDFFKKFGIKVQYVGNPLFDEIRKFKPSLDFKQSITAYKRPIVALLPGSRKQEIDQMLSVMSDISIALREYHFVVAGISAFEDDFYLSKGGSFSLVTDQTYDLLSVADAAIVTSGTATLETALFNVPQVVVYKTSGLTYSIAKRLIKIKYISLVNLVANKEVVQELIQKDYTASNVSLALKKLLNNNNFRNQQLKDYADIIKILGKNKASETAARQIFNYIKTV